MQELAWNTFSARTFDAVSLWNDAVTNSEAQIFTVHGKLAPGWKSRDADTSLNYRRERNSTRLRLQTQSFAVVT